MTWEIGLVLAILAVSLVMFVTEVVRMDVTALLVLGVLAISGLVGPAEALSGFSNPAVVTVWAMFILSEGLTQAGVAGTIGKHVLRAAGSGEIRLTIVVMTVAGVLSAFMNNIGVAALMLPVVLDVARKTGCPPSRLLMPLAYGTLLGGLTTLIGTPPNLLISNALRERDLVSFGLFDYTPVGGAVFAAGVLFVAFVGRRILPRSDPAGSVRRGLSASELKQQYGLQDRVFIMRVPAGSQLIGARLGESRLGSALGLNLLGVIRGGQTVPVPPAGFVFESEDRLVVQGRLERLQDLRGWREFEAEAKEADPRRLSGDGVELAEVRIARGSNLVGQTVMQAGFRNRFGVTVLLIRRAGQAPEESLVGTELAAGDRLLVQGPAETIQLLGEQPDFDLFEPAGKADTDRFIELRDKIFEVTVPAGSVLDGATLGESRLGDAFNLRVLGIVRDGERKLLPGPEERLRAGDRLMIHGMRRDLRILRGLQELEVESDSLPDLTFLESEKTSIAEVALAPRSPIVGRTLRELRFRERYGMHVIAIWRKGRAYRSNLRDQTLEAGDAILLMGEPARLEALRDDPDFLFLSDAEGRVARPGMAPVAVAIMVAVLVPVFLGWLPIAISAIVGATLMVLTRCLSMEEAYRAIDWKAVFLIAGMLPLGTAMQDTGAAELIANAIVGLLGDFGPWPVIIGLYLLTAVATTIIPTAALVLLMAPIVIQSCVDLGASPHAGMMAIAIAASASFTSPISHPANILVMGPGGYRFVDYIKLGVPLALVVFLVTFLLLPIFWPV